MLAAVYFCKYLFKKSFKDWKLYKVNQWLTIQPEINSGIDWALTVYQAGLQARESPNRQGRVTGQVIAKPPSRVCIHWVFILVGESGWVKHSYGGGGPSHVPCALLALARSAALTTAQGKDQSSTRRIRRAEAFSSGVDVFQSWPRELFILRERWPIITDVVWNLSLPRPQCSIYTHVSGLFWRWNEVKHAGQVRACILLPHRDS